MKTKKIYILIPVFILLILISIFIYEVYISYNDLVVNNYTITSKQIDEEINMVIVSDLHENIIGDNNEKLINDILKQSPDIILIVGDMINSSSKDITVVMNLVSKLSTDVRVFYSLGNSEEEYINDTDESLIESLEDSGAIVLQNKYEDIKIKNITIRIGGMTDYAFGLKYKSIADLGDKKIVYDFLSDFENTSNYKIMMSHRPDSFIFNNASKDWEIDLVVSGHTHGGQVKIPILGGLYVGDQGWFPKYTKGIYDLDNMKIIISSGLGSDKEKIPRVNNRPEIINLILH